MKECFFQDLNSFYVGIWISVGIVLVFSLHGYIYKKSNSFEQNKDVGMGLLITFCLGVGIFLFPFFFMT